MVVASLGFSAQHCNQCSHYGLAICEQSWLVVHGYLGVPAFLHSCSSLWSGWGRWRVARREASGGGESIGAPCCGHSPQSSTQGLWLPTASPPRHPPVRHCVHGIKKLLRGMIFHCAQLRKHTA